MLGVGLRKLCPQDSFGYAFRERRNLWRVQKRPVGGPKLSPGGLRTALLCQLCPTSPPGPFGSRVWAALGALGALLAARGAVLKPLGLLLGLSRVAPGHSWGWFWDLPGADLDVLDDVCGAT